MAYDDDEFLRYSSMLDEAVDGLLENDITPSQVEDMVTNALENAE